MKRLQQIKLQQQQQYDRMIQQQQQQQQSSQESTNQQKSIEEGSNQSEGNGGKSNSSSGSSNNNSSSSSMSTNSRGALSAGGNGNGGGSSANNAMNKKQRQISRSLSPTPVSRRPAWKGMPEDDAALRTEVIGLHVPDEQDVWMPREMKRLTQFTRIFPLDPTSNPFTSGGGAVSGGTITGGGAGIGTEEDEDGDEDAEREDTGENGNSSNENKQTVKIASYEDILVQVSLFELSNKHEKKVLNLMICFIFCRYLFKINVN